MRFVLSPAKTLDYDTPPTTEIATQPAFLEQAAVLIGRLRDYTPAALAELMGLSDKLATLNVARYQAWTPEMTPGEAKQAVLAFKGDVYEGLDAPTLDARALDYLQRHLRILSGLYGLLRPLDLIRPYRLEMGTRLANPAGRDLYAFWGDTLTRALNAEFADDPAPVLVNLASEEYFSALKPKQLNARVVDCVFEDFKNGRYKIISFYAKRARGLMMRYAALHGVTEVEALKGFDLDGYRFDDSVSRTDRWVFRRAVDASAHDHRHL
jgi:hypothetical protein